MTSQLKMLANRLKIALVQLSVATDKSVNITKAKNFVQQAAKEGARVVILPECFNCPYGTQYFAEYAEEIPGPTTSMLSEVARTEQIHLVGGSIPEKREGRIYNTSTVYDPTGNMVLKYSKMHLFDIDIPGKIRFQESEVLTPGDKFAMFDVSPRLKIGIGICYDLRFAELGMILAREGCNLLVYPGAFNMTTGPLHWELLQRARATDNQVFVASCSPARDEQASYVAWGHSSVVSPWGEVIAKASEKEEIVYCELNLDSIQEVRDQIPVTKQRREDMYNLQKNK